MARFLLKTLILILGIALGIAVPIGLDEPVTLPKLLSSSKENIQNEDIASNVVESIPEIFPPFQNDWFIYRRRPCINLGDEGCVNGIIPGSGADGGYLTGSKNPGK